MQPIVVDAEQLFYSRVEAAYSDHNRSGYQVVYHTPGLTETDVKEIENRVQCFKTGDVSERFQYFRTGSGKAVFTVSRQLLETDTTITDRSGRPGAFIAHCYILAAEQFARLDNNPFLVLDLSDSFVDNAQDMIARRAERAPSVSLMIEAISESPPVLEREQFPAWTEDEFLKLWSLAVGASDIVESGRTVMIQSETNESEELLRLILHYTPDFARIHCTFDTFVDGCSPQPGEYWANLSQRRNPNPKFIAVRLDQPGIAVDASEVASSTNPKVVHLSEWLRQYFRQLPGTTKEKLIVLSKRWASIYALSTAYASGKGLETWNNPPINRDVLDDFVAFHRSELESRLLNLISPQIGAAAAPEFVTAITKNLHNEISQMYLNGALTNSLSAEMKRHLAHSVYNRLITNRINEESLSWKDVQAMAMSTGPYGLVALASMNTTKTLSDRFFGALGQKSTAERTLTKALAKLSQQPEAFAQFVLYVTKRGELDRIVTTETADPLMKVIRDESLADALPADQLAQLCKALLSVDAGNVLHEFIQYVPRFSRAQAEKLSRAMKKQNSDKGFEQAIEQHLSQSTLE